MDENAISNLVIGAALEVQKELGGPGLLEDVYEEAVFRELTARQLKVQRQHAVKVHYKGQELRKRLVLDLLVENKVVVEIKATEKHNTIFEAQLLTYLRVSSMRLGLLINFGERHVAKNVRRVVNGLV